MIRRWRASTTSVHRIAWTEKVLGEMILLAEEEDGCDLAALCADCPELLPEFRRRIEQMRRVTRLFGIPADGGERSTVEKDSLEPGRHIGPYKLIHKLGEGGAGQVFQARDTTKGDIVAIKLLTRSVAENPVTRKRFEQEFTASRKIDHPNVIRALAHGIWEEQPYLVMEFVEGESVGALLDRVVKLPEAEAVRLIAQVCEGLAQAHQRGIIHRDIKPENILVTRQGVAKLADLGLVKDRNAMLNLTGTGRSLGTPHYMAPEQHDAAKTAEIRSDIFALGATLYKMVTGEPPYGGDSTMVEVYMRKKTNDFLSPRRQVSGLSRQTDRAIHRALQADVQARPASCREFVQLLIASSP
jgi:eukaryotic-like serine/threonine-protein kinase